MGAGQTELVQGSKEPRHPRARFLGGRGFSRDIPALVFCIIPSEARPALRAAQAEGQRPGETAPKKIARAGRKISKNRQRAVVRTYRWACERRLPDHG